MKFQVVVFWVRLDWWQDEYWHPWVRKE